MAFFARPKSIVGLDIGAHSVKAVQLTKTGGNVYLTGFARIVLEAPEDTASAIGEATQSAMAVTRRCVSAVSGRSVIVRYVSMMPMPDSVLRQEMSYEADKYIPYSIDEVQLYCCRLSGGDEAGKEGTAAGGQMKVLLVAAKRTLIEERLNLLKEIGLEPTIIDVDAFALGNAFERRAHLLGQTDNRIHGLLDIGATKTNINILKGADSLFTREIYIAGNDITEAIGKRIGVPPEEAERMKSDPGEATETIQDAMLPVLEDIGSEVRLSFDYFENQFDETVGTVWLSGGTAGFPRIEQMVSDVLSIETRLWDPTEGLDIGNPRLDISALEGMNSDMAVAIGLASRIWTM